MLTSVNVSSLCCTHQRSRNACFDESVSPTCHLNVHKWVIRWLPSFHTFLPSGWPSARRCKTNSTSLVHHLCRLMTKAHVTTLSILMLKWFWVRTKVGYIHVFALPCMLKDQTVTDKWWSNSSCTGPRINLMFILYQVIMAALLNTE